MAKRPITLYLRGEDSSSGEQKMATGRDIGDKRVMYVSSADAIAGEDTSNDVMKVEGQFNYHYQAAASANVVVKASSGYLKGIILGGVPIADAIIEVSDHASDGDGNVIIYAAGGDGTDALLEQTLVDKHKGYIPVELNFATGITADITNQTHVTFIYR